MRNIMTDSVSEDEERLSGNFQRPCIFFSSEPALTLEHVIVFIGLHKIHGSFSVWNTNTIPQGDNLIFRLKRLIVFIV